MPLIVTDGEGAFLGVLGLGFGLRLGLGLDISNIPNVQGAHSENRGHLKISHWSLSQFLSLSCVHPTGTSEISD